MNTIFEGVKGCSHFSREEQGCIGSFEGSSRGICFFQKGSRGIGSFQGSNRGVGSFQGSSRVVGSRFKVAAKMYALFKRVEGVIYPVLTNQNK